MSFDKTIKPRRGQMLIEPHRDKISKVLIDPDEGRVPPTVRGTIIKLGSGVEDDAIFPGVEVQFIPHGGTLLEVPEGHPERMVVSVNQIVGFVGVSNDKP